MIIGIDVGGTHTDAVLLDLSGPGFSILATSKTETRPDDILASVRDALRSVLEDRDQRGVTRLTLSTTLTTNALAQGRLDETMLLLVPGPGMNVEEWAAGLPYRVLSGYTDHRGRIVVPLDEEEVAAAAGEMAGRGIPTAAVAVKFAVRNADQELGVEAVCTREADPAFVSLSHTLSGSLNFPRRAVSAYYNAALWRLHGNFTQEVLRLSENLADGVFPMLLMAHGCADHLDASPQFCVEAANSGPAASILGIMALARDTLAERCVLLCDVGGSTTDLALVMDGSPVAAREGLTLGGRKTAVAGLATFSVAVGGDSPVTVDGNGRISLGQQRKGPCLAAGGPVPTLTDALNVLGHAAWGDGALSRNGMEDVASRIREAGGGQPDAEAAALAVAQEAARLIRDAAGEFVADVNSRPVYTVAQLLEGVTITPDSLCAVGGGGAALAPVLEQAFGLPVFVPDHAPFANAVGAALARTGMFCAVHADTERRVAVVLPDGGSRKIPSEYTLENALMDARQHLMASLASRDPLTGEPPIDVVHADAFTMHDDRGHRVGQSIRVLCRVRPGLLVE